MRELLLMLVRAAAFLALLYFAFLVFFVIGG